MVLEERSQDVTDHQLTSGLDPGNRKLLARSLSTERAFPLPSLCEKPLGDMAVITRCCEMLHVPEASEGPRQKPLRRGSRYEAALVPRLPKTSRRLSSWAC